MAARRGRAGARRAASPSTRASRRSAKPSTPSRVSKAAYTSAVEDFPSSCGRRTTTQKSCGRSSGSSSLPSPEPSCGPSARKNGTSAPICAARPCSSSAGSGSAKRLVREPERGRRIGAAAAETGGDRDLLLDLDPPASLDPRGSSELAERRADKRVAGEAVDRELRRLCELDAVDEVDPLEDGQDLVLAVVAQRADDEREVDLGRRRSSAHRRALASATNSAGASASARVAGGMTDRGERFGSLLARREPGECERVRQRLAPVRERGRDDLLHAAVVRRQLRPPEGDERRVDVRLRPEDGAGDRVEPGSLGGELDEHRDGAVRLRSRLLRKTSQRPPAAPSRTTAGRSAARRGSRRPEASRRCTGGWRRASSRPGEARPEARRRRRASTLSASPVSAGSSVRSISTAWTWRTRSAR